MRNAPSSSQMETSAAETTQSKPNVEFELTTLWLVVSRLIDDL